MIIDGRTLAEGPLAEADVCIIGAGIAGLHLAARLSKSGHSVIVLEAGSETPLSPADEPHPFVATALPINPQSRRIALGGTSTAWGGLLCPLDPIDLEERAWVPFSGWPFSFKELAPYYDKAAAFLKVPPLSAFSKDRASCDPFAGDEFSPAVFYLMERSNLNFAERFQETIEDNRVRVILNAPVEQLEGDGGHVHTARVRTKDGHTFSVTASRFVLASGGIENPRLLLASKSDAHPRGIGNAHDQVGRYYMDHPKLRLGTLALEKPFDYALHWGLPSSEGTRIIGVGLSEEVQRAEKLLNSYAHAAFVEDRSYRLASKLLGKRPKRKRVELMNYLEQAPRPENRVTFENGETRVHWSVSPEDTHSLAVLHEHMAQNLSKDSRGTLTSPLLSQKLELPFKDASHHMGTTRMGNDPKTSVTDRDARVHGIENLFVAGSSLFPTGGYANPTYTIFALTEKLAEHLQSQHEPA